MAYVLRYSTDHNGKPQWLGSSGMLTSDPKSILQFPTEEKARAAAKRLGQSDAFNGTFKATEA